MKTSPAPRRAGFTLVEILISLTIVTTVSAMALSSFLMGLRFMYKDTQRLMTNARLRSFTAQIAKETVDASDFYVFPSYKTLDGNVDLAADVAPLAADSYGTQLAQGDCLVLITRVNVDDTSNIRQFKIYYRHVASQDNEGALRYYESQDYGASGTTSSLTTLLNAVNLNSSPLITGSKELANRAKGRPIPGATATPLFYPIFSTESPTPTPVNETVSINVEFINGSTINHLLSSSSFNYTISPRR